MPEGGRTVMSNESIMTIAYAGTIKLSKEGGEDENQTVFSLLQEEKK